MTLRAGELVRGSTGGLRQTHGRQVHVGHGLAHGQRVVVRARNGGREVDLGQTSQVERLTHAGSVRRWHPKGAASEGLPMQSRLSQLVGRLFAVSPASRHEQEGKQ